MYVEREFSGAEVDGKKVLAYYVYEAPVRMWHWINAIAMVVLGLTGYFIANPLPSMSGEASNHYLMGYLRFAHFAAAYIFAVGFIARVYWALVGNIHSRQLFLFPFWDIQWWKEALFELRWYLFLEPDPKKYIGHNPLAQFSMFFAFTLGAPFMILTGFALYAEGTGVGTWQDKLFGWLTPLLGGSQAMHTWHHVGMWAFVVFVMLHVYAAIREDVMSRQSMISTMVSGYRMFKD
jgi:Ni/Fe-hydrogenase 1 B-type cytochrome subunit